MNLPNLNYRIWTPVKLLWVKGGVHAFHDLDRNMGARTLIQPQEINKIISSPGRGVKYLGFAESSNYKLEANTREEFENNQLVRIAFGKRARRLQALSATMNEQPFVFGFDFNDDHFAILSSSALDVPFVGQRLIFHANEYEDDFQKTAGKYWKYNL